MLGDHGLWSKANFYNQSVHVPCIMRPARGHLAQEQGWQSRALVQQIDVPVTITDIAGASPLKNVEGRSLMPFAGYDSVDQVAHKGHECVLSELFGQSTLITDEYKLTVRLTIINQLSCSTVPTILMSCGMICCPRMQCWQIH